MRELVIIVTDLYLPPEPRGARTTAAFTHVPGIEQVARFGRRVPGARGWRERLLARAGRVDLEGVAPACIAAAALQPPLPASGPLAHAPQSSARWIATAVHLQAGLRQVHLEHRGLLRLPATEQAQLSAEFARTFGSTHYALEPLPSGDFLLDTPGIAAVATSEPVRCAGGELDALMPSGSAAAPLRRLLAEIEMWLHAQPLNESRRLRGVAPVSSLWPWGASGRIVCPARSAGRELPLAFGRDAWLEGLWHLQGSSLRPAPQRLEEILAAGAAAVLLVEAGGELHGEPDTVADALGRIDERFISPALAALRCGALDQLAVMLNDACVQVERGNLRRLWRRTPGGLTGYA